MIGTKFMTTGSILLNILLNIEDRVEQKDRIKRGYTIFMKQILENMMGYVALADIVQKVVRYLYYTIYIEYHLGIMVVINLEILKIFLCQC